MLVRNMQAMRNDRGRLAAGHRFHELSKPLEDGDNLWADANAWSRRLAHHINRRVVREQLSTVVGPAVDQFTFDSNEDIATVGQFSVAEPNPQVSFRNERMRRKDKLYRLGCRCVCAHVTGNHIYFRS